MKLKVIVASCSDCGTELTRTTESEPVSEDRHVFQLVATACPHGCKGGFTLREADDDRPISRFGRAPLKGEA